MTVSSPEERAVGPLLVMGLGNPGTRYSETRHNLGFRVIEELARRSGVGMSGKECNSLVGTTDGLILVMPQTFMNRSGYAARCLTDRHELPPERFLVVYDETRLPLGRLRLREHGGPGGHRGMESVIRALQTDRIPRLRLGIGGEELIGDDLVDFVLEPFAEDERESVEDMVERAVEACESWISEGPQAAMTRFNQG